MKLIQRYLLSLFIPVFLTAMLFFILLLQLGDLFAHLVEYLQNGANIKDILKVLLFYLPKCISYSVPLAILFAGSYTLGNMYARNELTAIFSSGVSLGSFTLPLLIFAFILSIGMIFFEDKFVIKYSEKKKALTDKILNQEETLNSADVVILSELGKVVYMAEYYDDFDKSLTNAFVIVRDGNGDLDIVVRSSYVKWDNGYWKFREPLVYDFNIKNEVYCSREIPDSLYFDEPPESFQKNISSVDEMRIAEAKIFITKLRKKGLPYHEALSKYYHRFSFPFTIFIVLFLSISLGGKFKKNILLMSVLFSLGIATVFYVTEMVTMLVAKWEYISPLAGAWTPILFFAGVSIYLLKKART